MKKRNRLEATKLIHERLIKGPAYPRQLSQELGIPESTIKYNLGKTLPQLGLIKQLKDGRYASVFFSSEEGKVRDAYEIFKRKRLRSPKPEEIAHTIKEKPEDARGLLFKYIEDYSEPTDEQIKASSIRQLEMICYGIDLPKNDVLLSKGLKYVQAWGIYGEYLLNYYNKRDKFQDWDKAKSYLEEFSELAPRIHKFGIKSFGSEVDTLYLEFEWAEGVQCIIDSLPELRERFQERCQISISEKAEGSVEAHKRPFHLWDETITDYI